MTVFKFYVRNHINREIKRYFPHLIKNALRLCELTCSLFPPLSHNNDLIALSNSAFRTNHTGLSGRKKNTNSDVIGRIVLRPVK